MVEDPFRIDRLLRVFIQASGTYTDLSKPFLHWPEPVRRLLSVKGEIMDAERPFLAYVRDCEEWTVITLQRVIWRERGCTTFVYIKDLIDATIPESVLGSLSPQVKRQFSRLRLVSTDGTAHVVPFEAGKPFAGFWNVLKMMIAQEQNLKANE